MRRGLSPTDAALETLRRVVATTEPRLLDEQGRPTFGLTFYGVNKNGDFGAATLWSGSRFAAFDGATAALHDTPFLYERA
jgi:N4-(beta-N-acetylglucosaminyl)-L-asparaginase